MRRSEGGFTLVEMLVVLLILAILMLVGIAAYLGMRDRASDGAAKAVLRQALPSVHAYSSDHGTWAGMTLAALRADYDRGLDGVTVVSADADGYCLQAIVEDRPWFAAGPPLQVSQASCA